MGSKKDKDLLAKGLSVASGLCINNIDSGDSDSDDSNRDNDVDLDEIHKSTLQQLAPRQVEPPVITVLSSITTILSSLALVWLESPEEINVQIKTLTGEIFIITVDLSKDFVEDLRKKLGEKYSGDKQRLLFKGMLLEDGHKLKEYDIQKGNVIRFKGSLPIKAPKVDIC